MNKMRTSPKCKRNDDINHINEMRASMNINKIRAIVKVEKIRRPGTIKIDEEVTNSTVLKTNAVFFLEFVKITSQAANLNAFSLL